MILIWLSRALVVVAGVVFAFGQPQTVELPPFPDLSKSQLDGFEAWASEQIRHAQREALENPRNAASVGRLGMLLHAYELHNEAAACYQRARLLDPDPFPWIYYLAKIRTDQETELQPALELYREAKRRNPGYLPVQLQLIDVLLKSGLIDEADRETAFLLESWGDSAWVHYYVGRVKEARKDIEEAAQAYQRACDLAPRFGPAHYALGLLYRRLGRPKEALAHLQLYKDNQASVPPLDDPLMDEIESLKSGPYYLINEGKKLYDRGQVDEAFAKYRAAVDLNPQLVSAHVNLISIYAMKGNFKAASNHYQAALALSPHLSEAHYNYALALSDRKLYPQAEETFRKAVQYNPYFADAYNNLGAVLEAQDRLAEAEENYRKAIENDPHHREAYFSLGRIAMKLGKPREAIAMLLKSLAPEDEKTPTFMYALAYAYAGTRNFAQARYYGEKARQLANSYSDHRMVDVLDRFLGDLDRASASGGLKQ